MPTLPLFPLSRVPTPPPRRRRRTRPQLSATSVRPSSCGVRTWLRLCRLRPPSLTSVRFSVCHSPLFSLSLSSSFFHHSLASSPLLKSTTATQSERQRWHESKGHRSSVVSSTYSHSFRAMPALRGSLSLTPMLSRRDTRVGKLHTPLLGGSLCLHDSKSPTDPDFCVLSSKDTDRQCES